MDILDKDQEDAVKRMHNGCILVGGTGSGKTRTSLAYYVKEYRKYPLYVITTAKKRDTKDWEEEAKLFNIEITKVDSWNNIDKYMLIKNAFFIFDEQHATALRKWGKCFINISKLNYWITLSATPADQYLDLLPHFIANGYFRNKKDFTDRHVIYNRYVTAYPKIEGYRDEYLLERLKAKMYVIMKDNRKTKAHTEYVQCDWDGDKYKQVWRDRWNIYEDKPIENVPELFQVIRRVVNSDPDRILQLHCIVGMHAKVIVFYCFDYELELLRNWANEWNLTYGELNGHKHDEIPSGDMWVYFVQYFNSEAWNCIETDTMVFYSQSYSYKTIKQAEGRIDRKNTPFTDLYYYHLYSMSPIDMAIKKCLDEKKNFNERRYYNL